MPTLKSNNDETQLIPKGANNVEKRVFEAGILLEEFSKFASSIATPIEKIPGVGIVVGLVTSIVSSIADALSKLLENCVNIAIKHETPETVSQLQEKSEKLNTFAEKHKLKSAQPASDNDNLTEANQIDEENKASLNKEQKVDDKISEAGEMIAEFGPLVEEVCQSLASIPGAGVIAMLVGNIVGPIVSGLGDLVKSVASIDSQVSNDSKAPEQTTMSSMANTTNTIHDYGTVLDFPSNVDNQSNTQDQTADIEETIGLSAQ